MKIFTIIIFGLATLRTIMMLTKKENTDIPNGLIATLFMVITMIIAYVWFLQQFITLK